MIIRNPNAYDIGRAANYLTKDEKEWENITFEWMKYRNENPNFKSWVAVDNKEVVGVLSGFFVEGQFSILGLQGKTDVIEKRLFNTMYNVLKPSEVFITSSDAEIVKKWANFKIVSYSLLWKPEFEDKKEDEK